MNILDRRQLKMYPLSERDHRLKFEEIAINPDEEEQNLDEHSAEQIELTAENIIQARNNGRPVMLTYGAHLIKNGLAPVVIRLINEGWITHIATNGAGSIHDWEFAYLGLSTEDVRKNVANGCFGTWEETGRYISLAVAAGGIHGLGYGNSVGKMIAYNGINLPSKDDLRSRIEKEAHHIQPDEKLGALADMLYLSTAFRLPEGFITVKHKYPEYSIQCAAYKKEIPFTVHPGIGYDIIYTHPLSHGGAIGRGAVIDFLSYAESVSRLSGGVHITVGSAIMAPMVFEKSLSMANNLLRQDGERIENHSIVVVDIQDGGGWDWKQGEPPMDNPAYYLRFCKSFYRMGGSLEYINLDNRKFMLRLYQRLKKESNR